MSSLKKIAVIFGTRPEAIKLSPVISRFRSHSAVECIVCVTGQHREMLDQTLRVFNITPDVDLALMEPNQTLGSLSSRAIEKTCAALERLQPDMVLVQGDTTTTFCGALSAFYSRISLGHIEAGLRTGDKCRPFPEEMNRTLTSRLADIHFAPTAIAAENLRREGIPEVRIHTTGNTGVDAVIEAAKIARRERPPVPGIPKDILEGIGKLVLITGHRRESFGARLEDMCAAIGEAAHRFPDVWFVYAVHLNPNVREPVFRILGNRGNVLLVDPVDYLPFIRLMERSMFILTDSGGIQEEAPTLGKPVLVMRDSTERPEAISAGTAKLVGTGRESILEAVSELLTSPHAYSAMSGAKNPFGDGLASERVVEICQKMLNVEKMGCHV